MHIVILCGGSGERMKNYSLPKPLNMIYGRHALSYTVANLPKSFQTIHFIYSKHLQEYNFETTVINILKDRTCKFYCIDYFTRGPVESALIGIEQIDIPQTEPILFLDNDNVYIFPENWDSLSLENAFLGCGQDTSGSESYSFIKHQEGKVIAIREKVRISDTYCLGVYGFQSIQQFRALAKEELIENNGKESYMSTLFQRMIDKNISILYIPFPEEGYHIGTLDEVEKNKNRLNKSIMRVCFDLDNTLVTSPRVPGDYTTVEPIQSMIDLAKKLKSEGHTIIIYTARRMATHKHNVGAVIKDIGMITFNTLDKFEIPYDELIFGKPIADIYIDDKAVNPYRHDLKSLGLFQYEDSTPIINMMPANKFNSICLNSKNEIVKSGTKQLLEGQLFYYQNLPQDSIVSRFFPKLINYSTHGDKINLHLEYLKGIPLTYLLEHELFTTEHMNKLFEILDILHTTKINVQPPSRSYIVNNYKDKLMNRMKNTDDYPYAEKEEVKEYVLSNLDKYFQSNRVKTVEVIHGDFWLSNILLLFNGDIKLLDMRGKVDTFLTLGGDPIYDYAKLYQSLLGYDLILYNKPYSQKYKCILIEHFHSYVKKNNININDIRIISICLIVSSLFAISSKERRDSMWKWVVSHLIEGSVEG